MIPTRLLAVLGTGAMAMAQSPTVEFIELLLDPVGVNAGAQQLELRNTGVVPADLTGWYLLTPAGGFPLPAVVVPADGIALLHPTRAGTSAYPDVFLPAVPELGASATLALFRSAATGSAADLVDFVSWGGGQANLALAVTALQWPNAADSIVLPTQAGHSAAHYDQYTYGSRSEAAAWFRDGTPTLGLPNDGGGLFAAGYGCPLLANEPMLGSGADDNHPWLGETWRLDTGNMPVLPTTLVVVFGLQDLGNIPLDPIGIPGCFWATAIEVTTATTISLYPQAVFTPLPNQPAFVGSALYAQGAALAPLFNAASLLPTRALVAYPGRR